MKSPLRIAHASDVHLDTDYFGGEANLASRDYCRQVFGSLLERVAAEKPDVLALPGDLFDSNRASEETIRWAMETLAGLPFPVVMIPGNHDCLEVGAIFLRHDFSALPNVEMLLDPDGEERDFPDLQLSVWGKGMEDHNPDYRPLEGLSAPRAERWNLALGHGIYVGREGNRYRSSPVEARQIADSGYDYIALGHHHALLDVSHNGTSAYYSGAPIPISKDVQGTFVLVQLEQGKPPQVTIHKLD
jgi:DNA repair exonuclease SbcCD nuclease subunit